ncbi:MAG: hypothetical protein ACP5FT_03005 [Acidilobus sp.]
MSVDSSPEARTGSIGLEHGLEGVDELADEVARLLFIAGSQRGEVAVQLSLLASMIFDELISRSNLKDHAQGVALYTGFPMTDAADLVDCLGDRRVGGLLGAAAKALITGVLEVDNKDLELYADCLGWAVSPDKLPDDVSKAAAVLVSFTGALNRWLNELAHGVVG